jgi:hypothetical protein
MAVAAFLLRGHDFDGLMAYLKPNEICDYRYALVLWGSLCGYMEMNKEFLSDILTLDNYKNIYECLFHNPMGELKQDSNEDASKNSSDMEDYLTILEKIRLKENIFNALKKSLDVCEFNDLKKCIDNTLKSKECKRSTKQCERALSAYQLILDQNDKEKFKSTLKSIDVSEKIREEITLHFGFSESNPKQDKVKRGSAPKFSEPGLFETMQISNDEESSKLFNYQNINMILQIIKSYFPNLSNKVIGCIEKDLNWVLDPKYSANINNEKLIEKFQDQLNTGLTQPKSPKGKDMTWKNNLYKELDINAIIICLKKEFED